MSTLIVYSSRYGYTGECAELIREELGDEEFVIFTQIDCQDPPTVVDYDRIIIGGSVRFGRLQRKLRRFMEEYRALLLDREVGLYLSCLGSREQAHRTFTKVFPRDLREHAKASCLAGGMVNPDKLTPMFKRYVRQRFKVLDTRNTNAVRTFAGDMKSFRKTSPAS